MNQRCVEWATRRTAVLILGRSTGRVPTVVTARGTVLSISCTMSRIDSGNLYPLTVHGERSGLCTTQNTGQKAEPAREHSRDDRLPVRYFHSNLGRILAGSPSGGQIDRIPVSSQAEGPSGVFRVQVRDRKLEQVVSLKDFRNAPADWGWLGLAPDDSPLLLRDATTEDVYALDWEAP